MMTRTHLARCAPIAIAASAALPAIPALAQDAAPVIVLPPVETAPAATAPAPAPTIVIPAPAPVVAAPAPTAEAPVAQTAAPQAEAAPAPARTTRAAPSRTSAQVTAPVAAVAAPAQPVAAPVVDAPTPPVDTPANIEMAPAEPVAAPADGGTNEALIAGLLGAVGIVAVGGVALAASRRRRRRTAEMDDVAYDALEEAIVERPIVHEPVAVRTPEPAFTTPVVPATSFAAAAPVMPPKAAPAMARTTASNGDPVPLPAEVPKTFEERDALLKELVAAEPDRANPFTGVRARARRAKLIMQSLGQDFSTRKPRIDLSEYTNRWPALRGWQPATA